jgi:hypothetical protein
VLLHRQTRSQTVSRSMEFANLVIFSCSQSSSNQNVKWNVLLFSQLLSHMPHILKNHLDVLIFG